MPALQPVAGIVKVAVQYTTPVGSNLNILHVGSTANPSSWIVGDINEACHMILNAYDTFAFTLMSHNCVGFVAQGVDLTSVLGVEGEFTSTVTGGDTSQDLPQSAAAVISWNASRHYRGGHPRTYMGGMTVNSIADSHSITSTYQTGLTTMGNAILTNLAGGSYTRTGTVGLVAVHRVQHGAVLTVPLVDQITGCVVKQRIDSQRRRLGKE